MSGFSFFARPASREARPPAKIKFHYQDPLVVDKLSSTFSQHLQELNPTGSRPVVVVAIGTDRSTGDSLGPLVGTKLAMHRPEGLYVYGTLDDPVHASNLAEKLDLINRSHVHPLIVAIDACLGQTDSVGSITLASGAVKPGAGVNKSLPPVGEVHFTGIVNVGGYMEYFVLQNTRLSIVMKMADGIATAVREGIQLARQEYLPRRELVPQTVQ
ncbi:sporulation protein [Clostridiales bacterium PH28_bin88]|nr:sporulation protein [Clostridiales bacterium PH28_bin88]